MRRAALATCLFLAALGAQPAALAQPAPTSQPAPAPQPAPTSQPAPAPQPPAAPDAAARADALFKEGNALVAAGSFEEACPKFAASHAADPSYGAVFNLAECHLARKRTASAWAAFRDAQELARKAGQRARVAEASERIRSVEPTLHRLTIVLKAPPPGAEVKQDGAPVAPAALGVAVPADLGQHTITASAPGRRPFSRTITLTGEGRATTLEIALELDDTAPPAAKGGFPPDRIVALAGLGLAIAGGVTGGVLGDEARSKWERAKPGCNAQNQCTPESLALGDEARTYAHGSTAAIVVGGVGLTTAVVLWLTSSSVTRIQRGRVALGAGASVSPDGAALSVSGSF